MATTAVTAQRGTVERRPSGTAADTRAALEVIAHRSFAPLHALLDAIDALLAGIAELLSGGHGDPDAPVSGRVFKIERTGSGERVAPAQTAPGIQGQVIRVVTTRELILAGLSSNKLASIAALLIA